ncbi:MAG: HAMP domain-containing sensor histidine kinase [Bryobacteraceae bacterium]
MLFRTQPSAARRRVPAHRGVFRIFGDLKVRPKLMVLHNLFFLVLAAAVYFSLIPLFDNQVRSARGREVTILTHVLASGIPPTRLPAMAAYEYRESPNPLSAVLSMPTATRVFVDQHPGHLQPDPAAPGVLYRKDPARGVYQRLRIPEAFYNRAVARVKFTLFVVLGCIYILAVLVLESIIMPLYVYRPLRSLLDADEATQRGDRARELIGESEILSDEIGQIMRSRNATIAQLRRQEDALERAKRNLEEQDRLASLGLLSASVAHEINTPLAVLQGSIEKLTETIRDPHTLERLSRMTRVAERLRRISESLLDFARTRREHREPLTVRPLLEEAWNLVAIDEKAATAHFLNQVGPEDRVIGDADRLTQVWVNLLRNALNAIKSTGTILVRSWRADRNGHAWLAVSIEDDGPGIPPDALPEIFEAFVSTRLDARGTGLGLTVAEGIIQQHGGTISASNRAEGGARLEVLLPAPGVKAPE